MTLSLHPSHLEAMRHHAEATFPDECCGLLLGQWQPRQVQEVWQVANTWENAENPVADGESSNRRFLIDPKAFKAGYDYARQQGLDVIGTYHSHPNHPAIPSEFDRQYAFPWGMSCVIVSVIEGEAADVRAWILDEAEVCVPQALDVQPALDSQPTLSGLAQGAVVSEAVV